MKFLCQDEWTGRTFKSNQDKIVLAVAEINSMITKDSEATLNDLYDLVGLPAVSPGTHFGWNETFGIRFGSALLENGRPVMTMWYSPAPKHL